MLDSLYSVWGFIALAIGGMILGGIVAVIWAIVHKPTVTQPPQKHGTTVQSGLLAAGLAGLFLAFQVPSISIDISTIFSYASQIMTMMMPIVGVGAGISFGFSLVAYIIRLFRQVF